MEIKTEEVMIAVIARLLEGVRHIAVGNSSPVPGSAALLAEELSAGSMRVSMLGSGRDQFWTDGGEDLGGDASNAEGCTGAETIADGSEEPLFGDYAWYCGNNSGSTGDSTYGSKEVAQLLPNGYGLYDMHGNLFEWSNDWDGSSYPSSTEDPVGASSGSPRVIRGGGWGYNPGNLRSSYRGNFYPSHRRDDYGGFRLLRTAP